MDQQYGKSPVKQTDEALEQLEKINTIIDQLAACHSFWKSIDTFPTDMDEWHKKYLLCGKGRGPLSSITITIGKIIGPGEWFVAGSKVDTDGFVPTHWMPLPEKPYEYKNEEVFGAWL
jgi:hypothetical protein